MSASILATKLYIPPLRPEVVRRPHLIERLDRGLHRKLTLISAPAGSGKTTLVSEWVAGCGRAAAWLSLDEGDNDPARFLMYLIAALQTIVPGIGSGVLRALQSPQPPPADSILAALLNEIAVLPDNFVLVLDDYHLVDSRPVDHALTFLLKHLPPQLHLVIATREDPQLPLARLRVRDALTELRVADLRFTVSEATGFLNQGMGLNLPADDIEALERRTEGWIAGLQLAAISMQGHHDTAGFIKSFTGSHHFVLDYLVEEVLHQQPENIQTFLLHTSILNRLCGALCDAVLLDTSVSGQTTLEYLERANLFLVPLDNERRWYRYHHLFADLLRQRLHQSVTASAGNGVGAAELHIRASLWYEDNGLEIEAFHHAAAAHDIERAARLIEGRGMPLPFRGGVIPVLKWLDTLPAAVLDAMPLLWVWYASVSLAAGQTIHLEQKLQAAEAALKDAESDEKTRDLIGRIAATRATLAVTVHQVDTIITQSRRAMEYLHPRNLPFRTSTLWKLGYAYQIQGDRAAAMQSYSEAVTLGQASGNVLFTATATIGLGNIQEAENQLALAAESYRHALHLFGEQPLPIACEAHIGLARIDYEWNDLEAAEQQCQHSIQLARQIENTDRIAACELFLARVKFARGDIAGAAALLTTTSRLVRQHNFVILMSEVAAAQVLIFIRQGNLTAAAHLAETQKLLFSQARVSLAQNNPSAALAVLEQLHHQLEAKDRVNERLRLMVLLALAYHAQGSREKALQALDTAMALAEPGGFIRTFVDEGAAMAQLLSEAAADGLMPEYTGQLLAAFEAEKQRITESSRPAAPSGQPLVDPLSERELEVLNLIAHGLSNHEISQRLFLALSTVKGHNQKIYDKLQVQRRTEAVARARELGLL